MAGVFDTLLVLDGRPVELDRHLQRLSASAQALYGAELPPGLPEDVLAAASGFERARLRVDFAPGGEPRITVSPVAERRSLLRLWPVTVPGGLGAHKWSDRRLLDELSDAVDSEPLLCDLEGLVLESARANVIAVERGDRLITPPLDGRILPGATRAVVIELAREAGLDVLEVPVGLERLALAEEIFLTGSVAGVLPAAFESGAPRTGPITDRLAEAWRGSVGAARVLT